MKRDLRHRKGKLNPCFKHGVGKKWTGRDFVRELVRIRDGRICQNCKKGWQRNKKRLDVHHLFGFCGKKSKGYDRVADMEKLITLCHRCHYHRHDRSEKLKRLSYPEIYETLRT